MTDPVKRALQYEGVKFRQLGNNEHGMDCAGLVTLAYGIDRSLTNPEEGLIPQVENYFQRVSKWELQPGDLVVTEKHLMIFLGDGKIIHSTEDRGVAIHRLLIKDYRVYRYVKR